MPQQPEQPKSLEMRVAELEDKLAKVHISEEEMKTYQKVATALGVTAAATQPTVATAMPQLCTIRQCYRLCNYHQCYVCYYTACYQQCINECSGGCLPGGGTPAAGGFGGLGG
jgi:hypothetical protein